MYTPSEREPNRKIPFVIHLGIDLLKSFKDTALKYPIASGVVVYTQMLTAAAETKLFLDGTPPSVEEMLIYHGLALSFLGVQVGALTEGANKLINFWLGVEQRWRNGTLNSNPTIGQLRGDDSK